MSRFTVHAEVTGLGFVPLGHDTAETDNPREALFLYLAALTGIGDGPVTVKAHVHDDELDADPTNVAATSVLTCAAASPGGLDRYDEWVAKAKAFVAEHDGYWDGLDWDEDKNEPVFVLNPKKVKAEEEARAAVEDVDDEFAKLLASVNGDAKSDTEGE